MGQAARTRARDEFSLDRMVQRYQSFYCDVAPHTAPPRTRVRTPQETLS
jgi:hypothetical protein